VAAAGTGIFAGRANGLFDDGSRGIYWVGYPDVLVTNAGSRVAMNYSGVGWGAAAVQYDGAQGGGRSVYLGFPFETLTDATRRTEYLGDILNFLYTPPPVIVTPPQSLAVNQSALAAFSVTASGPGLRYQWRFGTNALVGATNQSYQRLPAQLTDAGAYSVVVTNLYGSVTSAPANLAVVPFEFTAATLLPGNLLSVGLSAVPGDYVIESSTNLQTWVAWTNVTLVTNPGVWSLPVAPESQRYFRARP
jgi:hypothetical protein